MKELALSSERLREVLSYDPETGDFVWRVSTSNRVRVGAIAGTGHNGGYRKIGIDGIIYLSHWLAIFHATGIPPVLTVDHIDGDKTNNRLGNLREATAVQNAANRGKQRNNTSGFKGVCWDNTKQRWRAQLSVSNRCMNLGYFKTPEAAHSAYTAAAVKYCGEFARVA